MVSAIGLAAAGLLPVRLILNVPEGRTFDDSYIGSAPQSFRFIAWILPRSRAGSCGQTPPLYCRDEFFLSRWSFLDHEPWCLSALRFNRNWRSLYQSINRQTPVQVSSIFHDAPSRARRQGPPVLATVLEAPTYKIMKDIYSSTFTPEQTVELPKHVPALRILGRRVVDYPGLAVVLGKRYRR